MATRWTAEDVRAAQARGAKTYPLAAIIDPLAEILAPLDKPYRVVKAKGGLAARKMNKLEAEYAGMLKNAADVVWSEFEGITLRLGNDCRYTSDFAIMRRDGSIEMHETKGFMRDDALVKIKVAAAQYPFKFVLVKKIKGVWSMTEIKP